MSRNHSTELEPLVSSFEHLSDKPRGAQALDSLRRIASIVKPLMRQRNWTVGTLAEFYPDEHNLLGLNINRGEKICLRLRYPGDDHQFLPLENVVDTMLHELAHNVIGPHNRDFHALWDKLRDEHEALVRKGYTGEGFLGRGSRLGGRRIPVSEVKRQARAAAEQRRRRRQQQQAAPGGGGGGHRLGGTGILRGQDARAVIAAAAEKRMKIERGCAVSNASGSGSGSGSGGRNRAREEAVRNAKVIRTTAEREDEHEAALMQAYIELIQEEEKAELGDEYVPPSQSNPAGSRAVVVIDDDEDGISSSSVPTTNNTTTAAGTTKSALQKQQLEIEQSIRRKSPAPPPPPHPPAEEAPETWTCDICTLINPFQFLICDACGTERPGQFNKDNDSPSPPPPPPPPSSSFNTTTTTTRRIDQKARARAEAKEKEKEKERQRQKQNALDSIRKFEEQGAYKQNLPVGWQCHGCGNWMETQWWTCSVCGQMKASS